MLLAIDTCFDACSAALHDDGQVVASGYENMKRGHAEALGPMVQRVFLDAGAKPDQLTRIVVTRGPGTFTGLRVGLSFAKGMALALEIPLVGIDSLTAAAVPYFGEPGEFAMAHKAGGTGLYYWALFDGATSTQINPPSLASMDEILQQSKFVKLENAPCAEHFAAYAVTLPDLMQSVEPLYLRPPDARPSVSAMVSTAHVRIATATDIPAIADIHASSFAKGWTVADLTSTLSLPGSTALVVELMGTIYGFVQFQWVKGEAEIHTICVLANYRRQHFARDLMHGLISHLQDMGTTRLFLEVAENNHAARGFYDRLGFATSGLRRGYYADGQNAVTMVKELTP